MKITSRSFFGISNGNTLVVCQDIEVVEIANYTGSQPSRISRTSWVINWATRDVQTALLANHLVWRQSSRSLVLRQRVMIIMAGGAVCGSSNRAGVAYQAILTTWNQHVHGLGADDGLGVAGNALEHTVGVMLKAAVSQPEGWNSRIYYLRNRCAQIIHHMTFLTLLFKEKS